MATDILGQRVDDDVGAVLEGTAQIGRRNRVVHNQGQTMAVRNLGEWFEVGDVAKRVADRLAIDGLGLAVDQFFETGRLGLVGKAHLDTVLWQGVCEKVVGTAIQGCRRDDIVTRFGDGHDRVGDRRLARGQRQSADAAFHRGNALFEDILGRIHDARVDVAGHLEVEQVGAMLGAVEGIRAGLVNRYGDRLGCRFGTVAGVDGERF
ncbi:MAG: hypothetical protein AW09_000946 [Candidatus Accumulibacter phosphatis]|uniref:Uncharacterized protein n=1 Tax=Candidatus Accumulibacter phosphatis TaxID=327160 RepID=A0A080LYA6_9PROT|nr:MAG: hypothetical protein AW09_000946 [Candidatus Accumulibacter phosphatis]